MTFDQQSLLNLDEGRIVSGSEQGKDQFGLGFDAR
jgi:hypothetical protein